MQKESWSCAQCSLPFTQSKQLEKHAIQAQHKAYRCFCGRAFSRRTAAVRHSKSHAGEKSHQCSVCRKTFFRRDHCIEHQELCATRARSSPQPAAEGHAEDSSTMSEASPLVQHSKITVFQTEDELALRMNQSPGRNESPPADILRQPEWERPAHPVDDNLVGALRDNDMNRVRQALHEGANVNLHMRGSGPRPLHIAAAYSSDEVIRLLVNSGADVNAADNAGRTALHIASLKGRTEAVTCLCQLGAKKYAMDEHGRAPLHLAAFRGHLGVARALRLAGADVDAEDNYARTPYQLAAIYRHKTVAACLLAEGVTALQKILAAEAAAEREAAMT